MAEDVIKRMNYFDRQFLRAKDFQDEQSYHMEHRRRHNRELHKPGVAWGLKVTGRPRNNFITIDPGLAIDDQGREIVLPQPETLTMPTDAESVEIYLVYAEAATDNRLEAGVEGYTRIREKYGTVIRHLGHGVSHPKPDSGVLLAEVILTPGGGLKRIDDRREMSTTLTGDVDVQRLRLIPSGFDEGDWPQLSAIAANQATLKGNLKIEGEVGKVGLAIEAGNVGIGTISPQAKLDVSGNIRASDFIEVGSFLEPGAMLEPGSLKVGLLAVGPNSKANNGAIAALGKGAQALAPGAIAIGNIINKGENSLVMNFDPTSPPVPREVSTSNVMAILGCNVGIGVENPVEQFHVERNFYITGKAFRGDDAGWTKRNCDKRLKKNIESLQGVLPKLLQLRGVRFEWRDPAKHGNITAKQVGLIADEVKEVFPEWVDTGTDGYLNLTVRGFEALMIEALREMQQAVTELMAHNKELAEKVASLEDELKGKKDKKHP